MKQKVPSRRLLTRPATGQETEVLFSLARTRDVHCEKNYQYDYQYRRVHSEQLFGRKENNELSSQFVTL